MVIYELTHTLPDQCQVVGFHFDYGISEWHLNIFALTWANHLRDLDGDIAGDRLLPSWEISVAKYLRGWKQSPRQANLLHEMSFWCFAGCVWESSLPYGRGNLIPLFTRPGLIVLPGLPDSRTDEVHVLKVRRPDDSSECAESDVSVYGGVFEAEHIQAELPRPPWRPVQIGAIVCEVLFREDSNEDSTAAGQTSSSTNPEENVMMPDLW